MLPATAPTETIKATKPSVLNEFIICSFEPMLTPIMNRSRYIAKVISFSLAETIRCFALKRKPSNMPTAIMQTTVIKSSKILAIIAINVINLI